MIYVTNLLYDIPMIHDTLHVYESAFEKLMASEYYNDKYKTLINEIEYISHCIGLYTSISTIQEYDGRFHDENYMKNYGLEPIEGDVKYIIVYSNYGHTSIFPNIFVTDVDNVLNELKMLHNLMEDVIVEIKYNYYTLRRLINNDPTKIDEIMKEYKSMFNIDGCKPIGIRTLWNFVKLYSTLLKYHGADFNDDFIELYSQAIDGKYGLKTELYSMGHLYINSNKERQGCCIMLPRLYRNYYIDYIVNLGLQYKFTRMLLEKRCI